MSTVTPTSHAASPGHHRAAAKAAIRACALDVEAKYILSSIADRIPDFCTESDPTEVRIAWEANVGIRTVERRVKMLEERGWLVVRRTIVNGKKRNHYTITPVAADLRPDEEVEELVATSGADGDARLAAWRASKGLPVAPTMTPAAVEILAALVELPALAAIATDNDATVLATVHHADTGEVVEAAVAIRALKKLAQKTVPGTSAAQLRREAAYRVRHEFLTVAPAVVEAAPPSTVRSRVVVQLVPVSSARPKSVEEIMEADRKAKEERAARNAKNDAAALAATATFLASTTPAFAMRH